MSVTFKKNSLRLVVVLIICGFAFSLYVSSRNFFPGERRRLPGPVAKNRVFAQKIESRDGTIAIMVSDWPHTFLKPYFLGEAEWPEKYSAIEYFWSVDGSVIACRTTEIDEKNSLWESAYDFKAHAVLNRNLSHISKHACDKAISDLIQARGGMAPIPLAVPDVKSF